MADLMGGVEITGQHEEDIGLDLGNPHRQHVELVQQHGCDLLVAVGGRHVPEFAVVHGRDENGVVTPHGQVLEEVILRELRDRGQVRLRRLIMLSIGAPSSYIEV